MTRLWLGVVVASIGCGGTPMFGAVDEPQAIRPRDAAAARESSCRTVAWPAYPRFVAHSSEWPSVHQSFDELGFVVDEALAQHPTLVVLVHGETSHCEPNDGALRIRRAASVARALIEHGFPPEQVVIRPRPRDGRVGSASKSEPDTCRPEDGLENGRDRRAELGLYVCERASSSM